eukprot:3076382-Rhodomonas_salina.1
MFRGKLKTGPSPRSPGLPSGSGSSFKCEGAMADTTMSGAMSGAMSENGTEAIGECLLLRVRALLTRTRSTASWWIRVGTERWPPSHPVPLALSAHLSLAPIDFSLLTRPSPTIKPLRSQPFPLSIALALHSCSPSLLSIRSSTLTAAVNVATEVTGEDGTDGDGSTQATAGTRLSFKGPQVWMSLLYFAAQSGARRMNHQMGDAETEGEGGKRVDPEG